MAEKGQAATEFLMTYGWAILAVIVIIGALAYFGAFSQGKYVTGQAIVNAPFYITDSNVLASLGTDGGVNLELKNGGEDYNIYSIKISGCGTLTLGTPQLLSFGSKANFQILCDAGTDLTEGKTFKGDIEIEYRKTRNLLSQTSKGTIAKKIEA